MQQLCFFTVPGLVRTRSPAICPARAAAGNRAPWHWSSGATSSRTSMIMTRITIDRLRLTDDALRTGNCRTSREWRR